MTAIRLLAELHDAGIRFALNGDRIRLEPTRGPIPPPMVQRIADHKPEAVALLSSSEGETLRVLLDLAIDEGLPGGTVAALSAKDLRACAGLPRDALRFPARPGAFAAHGRGRRARRLEARRRLCRLRPCAAVAGCPGVSHRLSLVLA